MFGGGSPHALALACFWLWSLHICEDDMAIEVALFVDVLGRGIEVSTATQDTFERMTLALFPYPDFFGINLCVKRDDGKGCILGQSRQFREEQSKHLI